MAFFRFLFRRRKVAASSEIAIHQPAAAEANQRSYLAEATYLLPKDKEEDQRLRYQHYALHHAFGNHYLAPLSPETSTILDVGCGTGIWTIDMAQQFPQAHLLGVDLALSSLPALLPKTCLFCQADVLRGLPFADQQFDFCHQRLLVLAIPTARWPQVVQELARVTRPQGWIELLEAGPVIQDAGPATQRLLSWLAETAQTRGIDLASVTRLGDLLRQAGCQAVEAQDIPVPLGSWAGRSGEMLKLDALHAFQALQPRSSLSPEAFEAMLNTAATEWEQNHACYVFHSAYGRRARL